MFARVGACEFMAAFTETQEQREKCGTSDHVAGDGCARAKPSGEHSQDETERDATDVHVGDLFEPKRIDDVEDEIAGGDGGELWRSKQCAAEGDHDEPHEHRFGEGDGNLAARDRAMAFDRMNSIRVGVDDVVERVDGAGKKAEDAEGSDGALDDGRMREVFGENNRGQDKRVFHPLMGTNRADHARDAPKQAPFAG